MRWNFHGGKTKGITWGEFYYKAILISNFFVSFYGWPKKPTHYCTCSLEVKAKTSVLWFCIMSLEMNDMSKGNHTFNVCTKKIDMMACGCNHWKNLQARTTSWWIHFIHYTHGIINLLLFFSMNFQMHSSSMPSKHHPHQPRGVSTRSLYFIVIALLLGILITLWNVYQLRWLHEKHSTGMPEAVSANLKDADKPIVWVHARNVRYYGTIFIFQI